MRKSRVSKDTDCRLLEFKPAIHGFPLYKAAGSVFRAITYQRYAKIFTVQTYLYIYLPVHEHISIIIKTLNFLVYFHNFVRITGFIDAFSANGSDVQNAQMAEELMTVLGELQHTAFDKGKDDIQLAKIYSSAITLWNICVAMRSGKKTNNSVNAKGR